MKHPRPTGAMPGEATGFEKVAEALAQSGWGVFRDLVPDAIVRSLADDARREWDGGYFRRARVGRGAARQLDSEVRGDHILWLDRIDSSPAQLRWFRWVRQLRDTLNEEFTLGTHAYEGHYTVYPEGSFYAPHLDSPAEIDDRIISLILYLNDDWGPDNRGALRLYTVPDAGPTGPYLDILPEAGTLVAFRSDSCWHEILPASKPRMSLTGWLHR